MGYRRASSLALLCALAGTASLTACGEKAPAVTPPPLAGIPPGVLPPGAGEEFSARLKEMVEERIRKGGAPTLPAGFAPLKASDVELYLKVRPELNKTGGDMAALTKLVEPHGLTGMQWIMLQARVVGAAMSLRMLGATWRDYARSQLPAIGLGVLTAAVAHLVRRPVGHGVLRQRARIPDHGRLQPGARRHDADPRSVGRQSLDG